MRSSEGRAGRLRLIIDADRPDLIVARADKVQRLRDALIVEHHNAYVNTGLNISLDREWGINGPPAAIGFIGVDSDSSTVTAATTFLHGSSTTAAPATTLNGSVAANATTFVVASATGIAAGMGFTIAAGGGTLETGVVASIASTTVTVVTPLSSAHNTGTAVNFLGQVIKAISPAATRTNQTTTGGATFANADFATGGGNAVFKWQKIGLLNTSTDAGTGLVDVVGGTGGSSPYTKTFTLDLTAAGTFSVTAQIAVTAIAI